MFFLDYLSMQGVWGNLIAAASGVTFALFTVFMRMQKDGSPLESVLLGNILTALIGLPFLSLAMPTSNGWLLLVGLGVVQLGIPYILFSRAIKHATALEAILIPIIEPLLNPLWVFLIMVKRLEMFALAGGVIVMAAVTNRCVMAVMA